jgi:hypothetical protein
MKTFIGLRRHTLDFGGSSAEVAVGAKLELSDEQAAHAATTRAVDANLLLPVLERKKKEKGGLNHA